jgi:hypothetical protein
LIKEHGHRGKINMLLKNLFEATQGKAAVLGWGRGMGHKGHMLLAKAVIHHAQQQNAKPFFVVSRTSLVDPATGQAWADKPTFTKTKDDPLSPEEKLATYRKVFPQNAEVFSVATPDASTLDKVLAKIAGEGFSKVILIVGEQEKASFSFLTRPDKSGVPPYQRAGLTDLEIISRQDTTEPSSVKGGPEYQEGPRATPMRQVLLDPSKSEEEQFAVWRRDMPDNLSDEEVKDLMLKAKQRMAAVPVSKGKKAAAVEEEAAGVGVIASKKQAKDPRYSMSLTRDVRPGQVEKNLKAFGLAEDNKESDYGADYQDKVKRLGQMAKQGERKTVWDPVKRVYKTVPVNAPKKQGVAEGKAVEPDPKGYQKDLLTTPKNSLVIDTPGDLDWYKLGQHYPTLGTDDPHEYGQGDSDMVIIPYDKKELIGLKQKLDRLKMRYKEIGGGHEQPEIHDKVEERNKPNDPIVRQIQQMLNDKFGANLDIDGYLGPLTKKSIKKFLPSAKTGSAPKPGSPTAVQSISESVDPKVSIVFDKYNPPDKDSIDGWKVAAKTKYWMVGTNKVKKDPKNPLPHEVKLVCLETAMPRVKEHLEIVDDWLALAVKAYKKYGDIELVVCTRHDHIFKEILKNNGHDGKHGYFNFDKVTKVATPYYRHDKELKQALINKDKTAFKRSSGVSPDKRIVAEHKRYEYFDLLEKFMIKRVPIVSLNESKFLPLNESIESQMENLIKRLENK